jgi:D-glycero-alpha-D-manno-heptose 1-phosphate guanylyltransferase
MFWMIKEAIILAGGFGTRLRSVVADVPKCMAPVNGIPFINFLFAYLKHEGVQRFILSLGYKSEIVIDYINRTFKDSDIEYVVEDKPLGTGGAIKLACNKVIGTDVLILNGDTLFNIDLKYFSEFHKHKKADFTTALKQMKNFSRYGSVEIDNNSMIMSFNEKQFCANGLINGGVYLLKKDAFLQSDFPEVFSFEKDFLEAKINLRKFYGLPCDYYFIDIGVPEEYEEFIKNYNLILSKSKYIKTNPTSDFIGNLFFEGLANLLD